MKIAILYICTGRYNVFFNGFYLSCKKYLLNEAEKHFYVWTDDERIGEGKEDVTIIHKECAGFPADSLFRFEMFLQAEEELKKYDYIYFFNANSEIRRPIGEEILPDSSGLAMGIWPGKREHQHPMFFPYERNKKSLAYVAPHGKNYTYYIRDDYNRGIIAKVHDESHINAYLRTHACKKLGREFCLPEEWMLAGEKPKNVFRNKVLVDPYFNKGRKFNLWARLRKGWSILWGAIIWYV